MTKKLVVLFCGLAAVLGGTTFAADGPGSTAAVDVEIHASSISWKTTMAWDSASLTVSGPEDFYQRIVFTAGDALEFRLGTEKTSRMPEGQYTWELRFSRALSAEAREALKSARATGDDTAVAALEREGRLPDAAPAQSGYFRIQGQSIVNPDRRETVVRESDRRLTSDGGAAPLDEAGVEASTKQTISGDLTVYNSLCVGSDCAAAESYGSDTIRLKENNLRIHFDDTSTGSFPDNDWRLVANESTNGGTDYFVIEDSTAGRNVFVVEAGARSNSLYVESDGDVGIGTANPVAELHLVRGDTPTLRLEQDGSSGFTPQTWDVAGNEAGFFIRDATNSSALPFRIQPGAASDLVVISDDDFLGIGAGTSPTDRLHVVNGDLRVERTTSGGSDHAAIFVEQSGAATTSAFMIRANATTGALEIKDYFAAATALKFRSGAANNSIVVAPEVGGQARVGIGKTTPQGTLDVQGTIFLSGAQVHPDYVFEPEYDLQTIEEHADYMWTNKHLPAMGAGMYDENGMARFELGQHQVGLLEELEKAHIYIDQLHGRLQDQESAIATLEQRLEALEKARERP